ncbi:ribonuclease III [Oryzomonas rubra]|uniref:Ribonuclease 3 n=1 Tax=Oryzomonas rubra TaxID=2509454 RepID=A0A5A9XSJ5_9BACT|nr:ribonuclease III [Oryzomonas rubra]KAA0895069.1 ribonuclease III [Oryzomonas rubra]
MTIDYTRLEERLAYLFKDRSLACRALTHPSWQHECNEAEGDDYQRLEFLGDAVLGMLLAEMLYSRFPGWHEGDLSRSRAHLAGQGTLADLARSLELGGFIRLGRGEEQTSGRSKDSILSDVLEALIAAVYRDGGLEAARTLVSRLFDNLLAAPDSREVGRDAKSELQELLSARSLPPPEYRLSAESGPPHDRLFHFQLLVGGNVMGEGEGRSKKTAQQAAAAQALERLLSNRER